MQDRVQIWRAHRTTRRYNTMLYLALLISVGAHITVVLAAIYLFWHSTTESFIQTHSAPQDIQYATLVESIYAPDARIAATPMTYDTPEREYENSSLDEAQPDASTESKEDKAMQIKYSQMISSRVHKMLASKLHKRELSNATLQVLLEVSAAGRVTAAQIVQADNIPKTTQEKIYNGLITLKLPPPLDHKDGKYLVPIIFD